MNTNTKLLNAARKFASLGLPVIALCSNSKHPQKGSRGYKDATVDQTKIDEMWRDGLPHNIGIATGSRSELFIIDIDVKNNIDGSVGLRDLLNGLTLPNTRKAITPSGGYHLYFKIPKGMSVGSPISIGPGVDIRGDGSYIVAPPSSIPEGQYTWKNPNVEIAEAPIKLITILNNHRINRTTPSIETKESITKGVRNNSVFNFCRDIRDQGVSIEEAEDKALAFNNFLCSPPLREAEVLRTLKSVYSAPPIFDRTDFGNARRLLYLFSQQIKFCDGEWFAYKNGLWQSTEHPIPDMHKFLKHISDEHEASDDNEERKALAKHQKSSQAVNRITAMIQLAESLEGFHIKGEQFDADSCMLGTTAGDINLATGELLPSSPSHFITKRVNITYDRDASCPKFEKFLADTFQGDEKLIEYVCKAVGYSLSGSTDEQCFFMLYGSGANGKSVFVNVLSALLGDYGIAAPPGMLVRRNRGQTNDIARLQGKRLLTVSEESSNNTLDEALMKQLTGGDILSARELYKDFTDFQSKVKIWMTANNLPQISDTDNGIKRRIKIIPFNNIVPREQYNQNLTKELMEELPGILNWALKGHQLWHDGGLGNCKVVDTATNDYLASQDPIQAWINDRTSTGPEYGEHASDLYSSFEKYVDENALPHLSNNIFARRLREEGFSKRRKSHGIYYEGIKLKPKRRRMKKAA